MPSRREVLVVCEYKETLLRTASSAAARKVGIDIIPHKRPKDKIRKCKRRCPSWLDTKIPWHRDEAPDAPAQRIRLSATERADRACFRKTDLERGSPESSLNG